MSIQDIQAAINETTEMFHFECERLQNEVRNNSIYYLKAQERVNAIREIHAQIERLENRLTTYQAQAIANKAETVEIPEIRFPRSFPYVSIFEKFKNIW